MSGGGTGAVGSKGASSGTLPWVSVMGGSAFRPGNDAGWVDSDGSGFSAWSYSGVDRSVSVGGVGSDRSWLTRVPAGWPVTGVAEAAFTAARESFLAAPPAVGLLHPVRVERRGGVAVLVFRWLADPRLFGIEVNLPSEDHSTDSISRGGWAFPQPQTRFGTWGPRDWADELGRWLDEELMTGAISSPSRRDGDLLILDLHARRAADEDRAYSLSSGVWGRVVDPAHHVDQESVPPVAMVAGAGFPPGDLATAGRDGTLVSWTLAWVNQGRGGRLAGQAVCVADTAPAEFAASATLVALYVAPTHRGRGVEQRLLVQVLVDTAHTGITTITAIGFPLPPGCGWSTDPTHRGRAHLDL